MKKSKPQLALFAAPGVEPVTDDGAVNAIAARLPANLRLGPSSWSFPGWANVVYRGSPTKEQLVDDGLAACARYPLFRAVSVDQSYYAPLPMEKWREYRDAVPAGFKISGKMWQDVTRKFLPNVARLGERAGAPNPNYLSVEVAREFLHAYATGLGDAAGPVLLQFPPTAGADSQRFCAELTAFIEALQPTVPIAVEIRNRELFTPRYVRMLTDLGLAHTFTFWSDMPTIETQMRADELFKAPFVMARLNLPPGTGYEERKEQFAPFNRIVIPQPHMRADIVSLFRAASDRETYVIANNKAEGCAPLTLRALAEKLLELNAAQRG